MIDKRISGLRHDAISVRPDRLAHFFAIDCPVHSQPMEPDFNALRWVCTAEACGRFITYEDVVKITYRWREGLN